MKYLIIGMGPGIGWSLANTFGKAGFEILMIARNAEKLNSYEKELTDRSIKAKGYAADLANPEHFATFIHQVAAAHPDITVVHYNASAFNPGLPFELPLETFISDVHTCITGALASAQAFYPILQRQHKAAFFFTGGGSALHPNAATFSLSIGKAGMRNLGLALAEACQNTSVQVGMVTVAGQVKPGSPLDPDLIAAQFESLWKKGKSEAPVEVLLEG
jgi:short-subunit dehydrogenase